jgi:CheY-like chemotaxis protein
MDRRDTAGETSPFPALPTSDVPAEAAPGCARCAHALAMSVGHAINNPLASLLANLDFAVDRLREEGDPGTRIASAVGLLADVREAAERIQAVVHRLRTASLTDAPPLARSPASHMSEPATDAVRRKVRVLVVDDDLAVGTALRRSLREYDVVLLDSAHGALARVAAGERFDLLLCDLMMPVMTGMDLHEEILSVAPDQAERMVFMTGGAVTPRARDFVATVPNPVLHKPFDMKALREMIRRRATEDR